MVAGTQKTSALPAPFDSCACAIQRLASQRWLVEAEMGAPCLIGSSPALSTLDGQIEQCCADGRPVLLLGSGGAEALQTAVAIHLGSGEAGRPFVKVDCATTLEPAWRWVNRALGGTLFICNTDAGTAADQEHLWRQLDQALAHAIELPDDQASRRFLTRGNRGRSCRLVVALKALNGSSSIGCPIPYGAWGRRTFKTVDLPTLSQRVEDIPALIRAALDYHGHRPEHRMTEALQQWCIDHPWPGNASQLEWVVARLALLTANIAIGAGDIGRLAPGLLGEAGAGLVAAPLHGDPRATGDAVHRSMDPAVPSPPPFEHWVNCVLESDIQAFTHLHAGLARALQYLCKQFHESISAEQLADQAHVSASHLRFLFRDSLGLPFKLFLQQVRIAHAKRLLLESPQRRITEVALSVGFSDFSHFQKCFRQIVGHTPGDLRRLNTVELGSR